MSRHRIIDAGRALRWPEDESMQRPYVTVDVFTARVRIFTPRIEVPFAGHPNLGTGSAP